MTTLVDPHTELYVLDPANIKEPPTGWKTSLRFLGPGMVTSAAVVGSGELLLATALGAQAGFVLLWLVLVSTFVKVAVQIELARWSISTGKVALTGYDKVGPRIAGRGWISYLGLLMFIQNILGQAGVLGAGALAFSMVMPIGGDPFSTISIGFWVAVFVVLTIAVHRTNKYGVVEKVSTVLVIIITSLAVAMMLGIQATPFAWDISDVATGLSFQMSVGLMGVALAMFGMTGVGGGELTAYTYWCVEKGYARWSGPNDGSEDWARRARGWISVMKKDAWLSWVVYTLSTMAFYVLGAAFLYPQGLVPKGTEVLEVISQIFTGTLGEWARVVFLLGAGVALVKTILANAPGFARSMSNTLAVFRVFDWADTTKRDKWMRSFLVGLPISWGIFAVLVKSPLLLITFAGIANAVFLMAVVIATLVLSKRETDPKVKDRGIWTIYLGVSSFAVFAVGALALIDQLSK